MRSSRDEWKPKQQGEEEGGSREWSGERGREIGADGAAAVRGQPTVRLRGCGAFLIN